MAAMDPIQDRPNESRLLGQFKNVESGPHLLGAVIVTCVGPLVLYGLLAIDLGQSLPAALCLAPIVIFLLLTYAVVGPVMFVVYFREVGMRVRIFHDRLVWRTMWRERVICWNEIREVFVDSRDGNRLTLTLQAGAELHFSNRFECYQEMVSLLLSKTRNALLPGVVASIAEGKNVDFGSIIVSKAGLRRGEEIVPWDEIRELDVDPEGFVFVTTTRGTELEFVAEGPVAEIPNFHLLAELINCLRPTNAV